MRGEKVMGGNGGKAAGDRGREEGFGGVAIYTPVSLFFCLIFFFIIFLWASSGLGFNFRAEAHSAESCQKSPKQ